MGGFYLDIIKDRQYTAKTDGHARRSAQTALYHIVHAFVRWIAPILSFTADEIWQALPGYKGDEIFTQSWAELPLLSDAERLNDSFWQSVAQVKVSVNKALEEQRNAGELGKSLEAEVELYCDSKLADTLSLIGDELRHDKCERCWHHRSDVGQNQRHPTLCGRCVENIEGQGESREFA